MNAPMPDNIVLDAITGPLLGGAARAAIIACARRGYGNARDQRGIVAVAKGRRADPRVVLAAFGFLPDAHRPRRYIDVLAEDECAVALLPQGTAIAAAFALCRAVHPAGCSFVTE